jgi:hypothetical protein
MMALEDKIDALIAALNRVSDGLAGGKPATATATTGKTTTTTTKTTPPKPTVEKVAEMAAAVKTQISKEAAVHLIKTAGGADKLAEIKAAKYVEFVAACEAALEAGEVEIPADDDGGL